MDPLPERSLAHHLLLFLPHIFRRFLKETEGDRVNMQRLFFLALLSREPNRSMTFYSDIMALPKSNITVLVDRLVKDEYVTREADEKDRRLTILRLTEKGTGFLRASLASFERCLTEKLRDFTPEEQQALNRDIIEIMDILNRHSKAQTKQIS